MQQRRLLASRSGLEEKHRSEIASLEKRLEQSAEARKQLQDDSNAKLAEVQASFEKELEALKLSQNTSDEERYSQLEKQFEDFKRSSSAAELEAKQKNEDLTNRLLLAEELKSDLMSKCSELEQQKTNYQLEINSLREKVCIVTLMILNFTCQNGHVRNLFVWCMLYSSVKNNN